jgi:microcystin-dependent protein
MYNLRFRDELPDSVSRELDLLVAALKGFLLEEHNENGTHITRDRALDFVPVGAINAYGGASAPAGWLLCDGSQVSRTTYNGLFNIIGTNYGAGDGSTTYNVPDLRQRFPLGRAAAGTGSVLGSTGGAIDHTHSGGVHAHSISDDGGHSHTVDSHDHTIENDGDHSHSTPDHVHGISGAGNAAAGADVTVRASSTQSDGGDTTSTNGDHDHGGATGAEDPGTSTNGSHSHGGTTGDEASGETGSANPPYAVVNYIIFAGV